MTAPHPFVTTVLTPMRPLTLIVAMTPGGVIGKDGKIPWRAPEDLRRFKALTTGHAIIMGRKTFDSIGKPLPNRKNIVLTSKEVLPAPSDEFVMVHTVEWALDSAYKFDESPFVIGGAEIYRLFFNLVTNLEITYVIRNDVAGDTFFPRHWASCMQESSNYPDLWRWRCTNIERAKESSDVEFHSFERRLP